MCEASNCDRKGLKHLPSLDLLPLHHTYTHSTSLIPNFSIHTSHHTAFRILLLNRERHTHIYHHVCRIQKHQRQRNCQEGRAGSQQQQRCPRPQCRSLHHRIRRRHSKRRKQIPRRTSQIRIRCQRRGQQPRDSARRGWLHQGEWSADQGEGLCKGWCGGA